MEGGPRSTSTAARGIEPRRPRTKVCSERRRSASRPSSAPTTACSGYCMWNSRSRASSMSAVATSHGKLAELQSTQRIPGVHGVEHGLLHALLRTFRLKTDEFGEGGEIEHARIPAPVHAPRRRRLTLGARQASRRASAIDVVRAPPARE